MTDWRKDYTGSKRGMVTVRNCGSLEEAIDDASWLVNGFVFNKGYYVGRNKGTDEYWIEFTGGVSPADRVLPESKYYEDSKGYFDPEIHEILGYVSRDEGFVKS